MLQVKVWVVVLGPWKWLADDGRPVPEVPDSWSMMAVVVFLHINYSTNLQHIIIIVIN